MSPTEDVKPHFIAASISPIGHDRLPTAQPEPLLPPSVKRILESIEISDYTPEGVDEAISQRYWPCVDRLVAQGADRLTINGLPITSQLGRARVLALAAETRKRTGIETDSQAEATIDALELFGATRIAIASRWSDQLNEALIAYLAEAGIETLAITSARQWASQAFSMSIEEGIKLAFQLSREAMRRAPQAQALLVPGGAWRSLAAVPILEEDFGIPVITNPIAQVWRLIDLGIAPPVEGWGRLLASQPRNSP